MAVPALVNRQVPRFEDGFVSGVLVLAFVLDWRPLAPIFAFVLLAGAAFGALPRFAATVGGGWLAVATLAFAVGQGTLGWLLVLVVAVAAGWAAATGGVEGYAT